MGHRIFIAINLPKEIKKELQFFQEKWKDLPVKWVKAENLHLTLVFLGYVSEEEIFEILKLTKEVAKKHQPFLVNLKKVTYGPPEKMIPRLIWVEGEKSKELVKLQKDLETSLLKSSIRGVKIENRPYTPHITLGRIRQWEFRKIDPEERPEIEEEVNLSFDVQSLEVMESHLKRKGPEYIVLESFFLGKP